MTSSILTPANDSISDVVRLLEPNPWKAETAVVYHVCESCAAAIMNDDYSGMEGFDPVDMQDTDTDTDYERVSAFVERVGYLCDAGRATRGGYWECEACDQVTIGNAYALETV